jgi:hypothetical protein
MRGSVTVWGNRFILSEPLRTQPILTAELIVQATTRAARRRGAKKITGAAAVKKNDECRAPARDYAVDLLFD